jgi:hypothetical protein
MDNKNAAWGWWQPGWALQPVPSTPAVPWAQPQPSSPSLIQLRDNQNTGWSWTQPAWALQPAPLTPTVPMGEPQQLSPELIHLFIKLLWAACKECKDAMSFLSLFNVSPDKVLAFGIGIGLGKAFDSPNKPPKKAKPRYRRKTIRPLNY